MNGGDIMDIGAMSIALNQGKVQNAVSLALMKKVMTTSNVNMDGMIKMIEAVDPNLGNSLDVKAQKTMTLVMVFYEQL